MNLRVLKVSLVSFWVFVMLWSFDEDFFTMGERLITLIPILLVLLYGKRSVITNLFGEVQKPKV